MRGGDFRPLALSSSRSGTALHSTPFKNTTIYFYGLFAGIGVEFERVFLYFYRRAFFIGLLVISAKVFHLEFYSPYLHDIAFSQSVILKC